MVGAFEAIFRLLLGIVLFGICVVQWFLLPLLDPETPLNMVALASVFFGNDPPTDIVRTIYLFSRGALGLLIVLYVTVPALAFFFHFRYRMYNNTIAIALGLLSVALFFGALIYKQLFYL